MCALTTTRLNRWKKSFFHNFIVFLSNECDSIWPDLSTPYLQSNTAPRFILWCAPLMMVHQQIHLHWQWLGKRHHGCPSTGWPRGDHVGVIFFIKCLFRHIFCWTSLYLQPLLWNPMNGRRSLEWRTIYPRTHSGPSFISHNLSTKLNAVLCSEFVGCTTVHTSTWYT
jgi:hypothetical protein